MRAYPHYRDSDVEWLGEVPEHWSMASLRWCSIRYAGGTPGRNKDHYWDGGTIPWINSGAVNQRLITEPSASRGEWRASIVAARSHRVRASDDAALHSELRH